VRLDETFFIPARKAFGAGAWDQASREGAALGFHDAIAYALQPARMGLARTAVAIADGA